MIKGVTTFHSETGTEGGYWAVQDEKFMGIPNDDLRCSRCGRIWQKERYPEPPPPSFTYWRDMEGQRSPEGYAYSSGYAAYDEPHSDLPTTPGVEGDFNDVFTKESNATSLECYVAGEHVWEPEFPTGMWSYEGLHVLKNGDHLRVFDKDDPTKLIWEGDIQLDPVGLFQEHAYNFWIHADQHGQDREAWAALFLEEHPCEVTNLESRAIESTDGDTSGDHGARRKRDK